MRTHFHLFHGVRVRIFLKYFRRFSKVEGVEKCKNKNRFFQNSKVYQYLKILKRYLDATRRDDLLSRLYRLRNFIQIPIPQRILWTSEENLNYEFQVLPSGFSSILPHNSQPFLFLFIFIVIISKSFIYEIDLSYYRYIVINYLSRLVYV